LKTKFQFWKSWYWPKCVHYFWDEKKQSIEYVGVEAYPISAEELMSMNYVEELNAEDEGGISKNTSVQLGRKNDA
jgi:hypothetical protein